MKAKKRVDSLALDVDSSNTSESQNDHIFFRRGTEVSEEVRFASAGFASQEDISIAIF